VENFSRWSVEKQERRNKKIVVVEMTAMIQAGVGCSARWLIESTIQVTRRKRRWVSRSGVDGYDASGFDYGRSKQRTVPV
jgi:hypothetical protein